MDKPLWSNNLYTYLVAEETHNQTPEGSPELTKRSWFGSLMSTDKDEVYTIIVKGKALSQIKADLIHAFLSVSCPSLCSKFFGKMLSSLVDMDDTARRSEVV